MNPPSPFVFNSARDIYSKLSEKAVMYIRLGWFVTACFLLLLISDGFALAFQSYATSQFSRVFSFASGGLALIAIVILAAFYRGPLSRMYLPKAHWTDDEVVNYDESLSGYYVFLGLYRKAEYLLSKTGLCLILAVAYSLNGQQQHLSGDIQFSYGVGFISLLVGLCFALVWVWKVCKAKKSLH